jgi:hypothetical protein
LTVLMNEIGECGVIYRIRGIPNYGCLQCIREILAEVI